MSGMVWNNRTCALIHFEGIFHPVRFEINLKNSKIEDFWNRFLVKRDCNFRILFAHLEVISTVSVCDYLRHKSSKMSI